MEQCLKEAIAKLPPDNYGRGMAERYLKNAPGQAAKKAGGTREVAGANPRTKRAETAPVPRHTHRRSVTLRPGAPSEPEDDRCACPEGKSF